MFSSQRDLYYLKLLDALNLTLFVDMRILCFGYKYWVIMKQVFQFVVFVLFLLSLGNVRVEILRRPSMVVYWDFVFHFIFLPFPLTIFTYYWICQIMVKQQLIKNGGTCVHNFMFWRFVQVLLLWLITYAVSFGGVALEPPSGATLRPWAPKLGRVAPGLSWVCEEGAKQIQGILTIFMSFTICIVA